MDEWLAQAEWRRWLDDHAPGLLLYARQKSRSEGDAQDLVQEAVLEAVERCANSDPPPASLVYATLHRRAIDLARSQERRAAREQAVFEPNSATWFDTTVEDRERASLVQNALNRLPEMYREVVMLKIWGELTFSQIAEALGIPANTAASRYRYGLEELRKLMRQVMT